MGVYESCKPVFTDTISVSDILEVEWDRKVKRTVTKLQNLKKEAISAIINWPEDKLVNSEKARTTWKEYLHTMTNWWHFKQKNKPKGFNFEEINRAFESPDESAWEYILAFYMNKNLHIIEKYENTPRLELIREFNNNKTKRPAKREIGTFLDLTSCSHKAPPCKRKNVYFDEESFSEEDPLNIRCFYEEDSYWNQNCFSYNELMNEAITFWYEIWAPILNWIPEELRKKYYPSWERKIKKLLAENYVEKLRDKQEILMYNLPDYEFKDSRNTSGLVAEKVVELMFRNLSCENNIDLKIRKWSVWEDIVKKEDLFITLEDKEKGIKIEKRIQLTISKSENLIHKKRAQLRKVYKETHEEVELVQITMNNLLEKCNYWRKSNRPIAWLRKIISDEDKEIIEKTFFDIVDELKKEVAR